MDHVPKLFGRPVVMVDDLDEPPTSMVIYPSTIEAWAAVRDVARADSDEQDDD